MRGARIVILAGALVLSGCLRTAFNRCTEIPPHPECAFLDAGVDAGPRADAAGEDALASDAPGAEDAGVALDAPMGLDAPENDDAGAADAPTTPDAP